MVDHIVELVEKKAAEIEAAQGGGAPSRATSRRRGVATFDLFRRRSFKAISREQAAARARHARSSSRRVPALRACRSTRRATWRASTAIARWRRRSSSSPSCSPAASARRPTSSPRRCTRFSDRGGEALTLRPEYTAGICRAFVSNGELTQQLPLKVFAAGPMFRYERPQKGRYRQFHQIDIEVLGAPEPRADIEVISVAADILERLGVARALRAGAQHAGRPESRAAYRKVLVDYIPATSRKLSEDSRDAPGAQSAAHPRQQGRGRQARSTPTRRPSPTT